MSITKKCKVDDCNNLGILDTKKGKRYFVKGYCTKHYTRLKRWGSPDLRTGYDKRHAIIDGSVARIPLSRGSSQKYAIVDVEYAYLDKYMWSSAHGYVSRSRPNKIQLHHLIMPLQGDGRIVDHINRNKLDNRRSNLRLVDHRTNVLNRGMDIRNKSGYTGVSWSKALGKWQAAIGNNYKVHHLGYYVDIKDAIAARKKGEIEYHG